MSVRFPYSPHRFPPIPAVVVTLLAPGGGQSIPAVSAHLDTAADRTLIPTPLLQQLGLQPVNRVLAHGLGTTPQQLDVYALDIEIPGVAIVSTEAIAHPNEPFALIGRDILNLFRVTCDGPNQVVEFH